MGDIKTLLDEIFTAEPAYREAELYSRGRKNEVWATAKLAKLLSQSANRYRVNIARRPIDAVLDRLEVIGVAVTDSPEQTVRLQQIYDDNELDLELPDALDKAETFGDAYLVEWPQPDSGGQKVDVFVNDPVGMRIIYDAENPRKKSFAGRTWLDSDKKRRVTIWRAGPRVERFIAKEPEDTTIRLNYNDSDFMPLLAEEGNKESWFEDLELGLGVPVFHLRTKRPYGIPEHEQAYGTQNMLTKQIATMMDATDGYGFPFRYALTKRGTTGPVASLDDDDWEGDDTPPRAPTATSTAISDGRGRSTRADPGTIAKLTDVDTVGQLQPADISNFLDPMSMTMRLSSVVTNTPLSYFDPSAASASGESKKEHEKPAVKKSERRLAGYNAALRDALAYAMALIGIPDAKVAVNWAPVASVDEGEEVALAKARQDAGVPFVTAMVQLGYEKATVEQWVVEATPDDTVLEHRVALLRELSQAAQALGAAASLGVIDQALAQQMITQFLTKEVPAIQPPAAA
jgi:hypothetical protein